LLPAAEQATTVPIAVHRYEIGQLFWLLFFAFFPVILILDCIPFFSLIDFKLAVSHLEPVPG
jgi:hypothetical protein